MSQRYYRTDHALAKEVDANSTERPFALVTRVFPDTPASRAGITKNTRIYSANGIPLHDKIDWLWASVLSSNERANHVEYEMYEHLELEISRPDSDETELITLKKTMVEDWGIDFDRELFDGMRLCKNACTFCFMAMLPSGEEKMRDTLYLRDDDFRLSFFQGNYVTLTNTTDEDIDRIIDQKIEPLQVSVHATDEAIREQLIGRNHQRGIDALAELLDAGVEVHTQIVLVPQVNDGEILRRTLEDLLPYPSVRSIGIVPLGYTRFQDRFTSSYSDDPERAREVIKLVKPFQDQWRSAGRGARVYLADEFYLAAGAKLPSYEEYDEFPQYEDGIGVIRSFEKEVADLDIPRREGLNDALADFASQGRRFVHPTGERFAPFFSAAMKDILSEENRDVLVTVGIKNEFFGGNVDVTGLLTAKDLIAYVRKNTEESDVILIPEVIFNFDQVTLDDFTVDDLREKMGREVCVVSCTLVECVDEVMRFVTKL